MKTRSIPVQLATLLLLALGITAAASLAFYAMLNRATHDSTKLTVSTLQQLRICSELQARLFAEQATLQQMLRQRDPDELEKSVQQLQTNQTAAASLTASCGESSASLLKQIQSLAVAEQSVVDLVLKAENGLANEKVISSYNPLHEAVIKSVETYQATVEKHASDAVTTYENQAALKARLVAVGVGSLLALLAALGWYMRRSICRQLSQINQRLSDMARLLGVAAGQVQNASQSLAEGATEQAASLEETSASLEEISSMTRHNAQHAETAQDLAKQARNAAESGAADMQHMSRAMDEIQGASNNITKILKTIDEIAFQTNILALNAAVEAARAGEAGMGFAVVADEVRNLAQRSAQAARETAERIEDSTAKSTRGVQLSAKVAQGLSEIVDKARRVDELVSGIATASREQSQGIAQVTQAMSQMDKVTQANAASAEESASASHELNAEADAMNRLVLELSQLLGETQQAHDPAPKPSSPGKTNGLSPARRLRGNPSLAPATVEPQLVMSDPEGSFTAETPSDSIAN